MNLDMIANQSIITPSDDERPDLQALFELALAASRADRTEEAIELWNRLLSLQPDHLEGRYLLGAEYAQFGKFGDALRHLAAVVDKAPGYAPARLQLGLLWMTLGIPSQALAVLQPMIDVSDGAASLVGDDLPPPNEYVCFALALMALLRDDFGAAQAALDAGLAVPDVSLPLAGDMRKLLERIKAQQHSAPENSEGLHGLAVSAYERSRN
jgi:tetratricopeptide (TPR) repeat protein